MPFPTPFHPRTLSLCTSLFWKEWAGYHAVRSYDTCHEREYFALRHAAGMIDVSPLYKYELRGPDAGAVLDRIMARPVGGLQPGRVLYVSWCDERGKLLDDGTVARLEENHFRVTAAEPSLAWFLRCAGGSRVEIVESTASLAALALQGPCSRDILRQVVDFDVDRMRFFRVRRCRIAGVEGWVSRTGYTGDLGFELWVQRDSALTLWDAVAEAGIPYRLVPVGLDALDVARVEAGFVMNGVDYFSANRCLVESRMSSPFEAGLGWTVRLDRGPFIGQRALRVEAQRGAAYALVGLRYDWAAYEALFAEHGLPPEVHPGAWRTPVPVFDGDGRQVGYATSGTWSPLLKSNLALATLEAERGLGAARLEIEVTVEFRRRRVPVTISRTPFYDPPAKRSVP